MSILIGIIGRALDETYDPVPIVGRDQTPKAAIFVLLKRELTRQKKAMEAQMRNNPRYFPDNVLWQTVSDGNWVTSAGGGMFSPERGNIICNISNRANVPFRQRYLVLYHRSRFRHRCRHAKYFRQWQP